MTSTNVQNNLKKENPMNKCYEYLRILALEMCKI